MKFRSLFIGTVLSTLMFFITGCKKDGVNDGVPTWNLQGQWEVSDVRFDGVVIRTYDITIEQAGDSVEFVRSEETISTGVILGDTIFCSDWDGYGISRIFIDSDTSMYSETPQVEYLSRVDFLKEEE